MSAVQPEKAFAVDSHRRARFFAGRLVRRRADQRDNSKLWLLAAIPIVAIPIENLHNFFGYSPAKLTIVPLLVGVFLFRRRQFFDVCRHQVFLAGMAFLAWGALAEGWHPLSDWDFVYRTLQMFVFAGLVAAVASTPRSFRRVQVAIAAVCVILAIYLVFNAYGVVSVEVANTREASRLRARAFAEMSQALASNLTAYTVAMGGVVALANLLVVKRMILRIAWGGVFVVCALGSFVPLSRGAFVALLAASALMLRRNFARSMGLVKALTVAASLLLLFALLPGALTQRFSAVKIGDWVESEKQKPDGRSQMLNVSVEALPRYWKVGVGSGNFWANWSRQNGFGGLGPHSGFFTAWIFYGLPGLVLLGAICFFALRHRPAVEDGSAEATALFGLLVLAFVLLLFTHCLYLKSFGIVLGLLMASSRGALRRAPKAGLPGALRVSVSPRPRPLTSAVAQSYRSRKAMAR